MSPDTLRSRLEAALVGADLGPRLAGQRVTVVIPDATRPLPMQVVLPPVLEALAGAEVTVLVGLGLHRPLTAAERAPLEAITGAHAARLVEHRADDPNVLVTACTHVGGLRSPLPASLHHEVVSADAVVTVGIVEPHQYAGFSGGAKGLAIGCAGRATISALHGLELLRDPGTRVGRLEGNRFQAALWRIVASVRALYAVQVVPAPAGAEVFAGPGRATFDAAVSRARACLFEDHDRRHRAVFTRVPAAKAQSFYQASRAVTYLCEVEDSVVEPGGTVVVEAACPEGLGLGAGELAFEEALARGPEALRAELEGEAAAPLQGGQQRAYVLARALERCRVVLVGAPALPSLAAFGVQQAPDLASAGVEGPLVHLEDVFCRLPRYRGGLA